MKKKSDLCTVHASAGALVAWGASCLQAAKVPRGDAVLVAESLVQTSLWGIDSHGIARLGHYLRRIQEGSIEPKPNLQFHPSGPCTGTLEGGHGLGIVISHRAMREAISLARANGTGIVGCRHSTHCGAIGLYGRQAARDGFIGIAFTHSDAFVAPHGGNAPFFGTNPICITIPSAKGEPVCLDMATSAIPWNKVMNARRENQRLPDGVALDKNGQPTTDPQAVAALMPLGGHKGYGLAFLIDILCGPLNGMPFGPHIPAMYGDLSQRRNLGSLMMAIDPMRFAGGPDLAATVVQMAMEARKQRHADTSTGVLVPGDPEYRMQRLRAVEGIPLEAGLQEEIKEWSRTLKVAPPEWKR